MKLSNAINNFLISKQVDGKAASTIKSYRSLLNTLLAGLGDVKLSCITPDALRLHFYKRMSQKSRYRGASQKPVQSGGLSPHSIESEKRTARVFFNWCAAEYGVPSPMAGIKSRQIDPAPKVASLETFVRVIEATYAGRCGERDRAMLYFLLDTGCRLGALLSLTLSNLDVLACRAILHEKGGKTHVVSFSPPTQGFLADYLAVRPRVDHDRVFLSEKRTPLTESGFNQVLRRIKVRAGVQEHINAHSWRHLFSAHYLQDGGDLATLSKLLGHSSIAITARWYVRFAEHQYKDFHAAHTPINSLDAL